MKRWVVTVSLVFAVLTMMAPTQLYASPTTEDDGYTYPDDASEEEKEEIDEQEQEAWEDAGRPGEIESDDEDNDEVSDDNNDNDNPPYCDEVEDDYSGSCFDRYDTDDITGLYPCKDGSQVSDPQLCESASESEIQLNELGGGAAPCLYDTSLPQCMPINGKCNDGYGMNEDGRCFPQHSKCPDGYHGHEDDESGECIPNNIPCAQGYVMIAMRNGGDNCDQKPEQPISCVDVPFYLTCDSHNSDSESSSTTKTIVTTPTTAITPASATAADISNCKLDGSADGIQQEFDTAKYQACKLHTNNDKIYYDGFVAGCMQVGNTKLICETVADSSILNLGSQSAQVTETQPTQAIQPTAIN
jgi:hypothetical protein